LLRKTPKSHAHTAVPEIEYTQCINKASRGVGGVNGWRRLGGRVGLVVFTLLKLTLTSALSSCASASFSTKARTLRIPPFRTRYDTKLYNIISAKMTN